ncbi:putative pre-16S rRNA nuclease [Nymphon striatum]|nr:putative pre-16S rRNA nuclease [Nymphon striatum]
MLFWIITAGLALGVAAMLALALFNGRRETGPAEAFDIQVYRDQLKEIERDAERGIVPPEEAERLTTEVSRRLLAADSKAQITSQATKQSNPLSKGLAIVMAIFVIGGGFGIYQQLGAPGYGDLSLKSRIQSAALARETRPSQASAEAQVPATAPPEGSEQYELLVQRLRGAIAERPDDLQGLTLLARSEAALGNFKAAYAAHERIIAVKGDAASIEDYANMADMMVLAAGGYVSPEAETVLRQILSKDPDNGIARYYSGLMLAQTGRPDAAFRFWAELLNKSDPTDPWVAPIREQIEEMAYRAGAHKYTLPPLADATAPGPDADDIEAAGDMSPEDRQQMIQGMVTQLSDRLATQGGTPEEWARLISAYGVLGNETQAIAIWNNAQEVFANNPEALAIVRDGARRAQLEFATHVSSPAALIGLDLGDKTIGVAVSDSFQSVATPLETVKRKKFGLDAARLLELINERQIKGVILGLPRNMDGSEGPRCQSTRAFARNFDRLWDGPIGFWDERLSTVAAERALLEADTTRKRRAEVIDHVAASYILQGVLDRLAHINRD